VRVVAGVMGDHVHLCVIDTGPGIPIDLRDKVVAPFQRLDDTAAGSGVGLGLSIAQGFVVAMGGQFSLDDTPGGGLTVTIGLPISGTCEPTLSEDAT
jgi:two-component system, OmpR family, sensor histidine kinase KdpD